VIFLRNARNPAAQLNPLQNRAVPLFVGVLAIGCILMTQAFSQDEAAGALDTIHGTVLNSVTHAPIARALVSSGQTLAALTDGEGRFEFSVPHRGSGDDSGRTYPLYARKPGFLSANNGGSDAIASPGNEITLYLVPEALIIGRVTLSTGEPASAIDVQIFSRQVQNGVFRWTQAEQTRSNSNGEFRFAELEPGAYKVFTHEYMDNDPFTAIAGGQLFGFPPVYYPNAADFASASIIQLSEGQIFQADISVIQHPYFGVRIPVANPPESNYGLSISVSPSGHPGPGYSLGYNRQRNIIDGSLPMGNYLVEGDTYGQVSRNGIVNLSVSGPRSEASAMVLTPNGSVAVNVTEQFTSAESNHSGSWTDGRRTFTYHGPRTYLNLVVESADDFRQGGGSVRDPAQNDDALVIENLRPGRYWLRPFSSIGYVASATMGGLDLLHQPFIVGSGATTPIEITMRDDFAEIEGTVGGAVATAAAPGAIYGTIGGRNAIPVIFGSPAYVYLVPLADGPGRFQELGVGSDGKFDSQRIVPGTYRVMAFKYAQPNLPYGDAEAMRAYESRGQVVRLSPGQKTTMELQIISDAE
jgi:hypothetical protein